MQLSIIVYKVNLECFEGAEWINLSGKRKRIDWNAAVCATQIVSDVVHVTQLTPAWRDVHDSWVEISFAWRVSQTWRRNGVGCRASLFAFCSFYHFDRVQTSRNWTPIGTLEWSRKKKIFGRDFALLTLSQSPAFILNVLGSGRIPWNTADEKELPTR